MTATVAVATVREVGATATAAVATVMEAEARAVAVTAQVVEAMAGAGRAQGAAAMGRAEIEARAAPPRSSEKYLRWRGGTSNPMSLLRQNFPQ